MTTPDKELKTRLGGEADDLIELLGDRDVDTRGLALGELISRKKKWLDAVLTALESDDPLIRATAAEGLAQIADPSTAEELAGHLGDSDPRVRSHVSVALAAMGDARAIDALVATIKDEPDILHSNFSRSSYALIGYGVKALPAVAPLLNDEDPVTRELAIWVFKMVFSQMEVKGPDAEKVQRWLESYNPEAPGGQDEIADKLAAWAKTRMPTRRARGTRRSE